MARSPCFQASASRCCRRSKSCRSTRIRPPVPRHPNPERIRPSRWRLRRSGKLPRPSNSRRKSSSRCSSSLNSSRHRSRDGGRMNAQPESASAPATLVRPSPAQFLSFAFCKRHGVLILKRDEQFAEAVYRVGALPAAIAEVRRVLGMPLQLRRVDSDAFDQLLRTHYEGGTSVAMQMVGGMEDDTDLAHLAQDLPEPSDLLESDDQAPIIKLINAILTQAVKDNASDIHIEPFENRLVVRFRIDGVLREVLQSKRAVAPLVVSRIKVMSKLDIAEKRLPQDGRISLRVAGRAVDVRVSTIPAGHGERVVLRLLDKQAGRLELNSLGMDPRTQKQMDELIHKPHGILLVTGPTGSGDRESTRLNSSHSQSSYAVFCLKKK